MHKPLFLCDLQEANAKVEFENLVLRQDHGRSPRHDEGDGLDLFVLLLQEAVGEAWHLRESVI